MYAAGDLDCDLVVGTGVELDVANPLKTSGKAILRPGFTVRLTEELVLWTTILEAGAIDADGVDLEDVVFANIPAGTRGRLRIKDGCLQAKTARGAVLIVR